MDKTRREWYQIGYRDGEKDSTNKILKEAADKILNKVKLIYGERSDVVNSIEEIINEILHE